MQDGAWNNIVRIAEELLKSSMYNRKGVCV